MLFDKPALVLLLCFVIHDHTLQEHESHIPSGLTPQKIAGTRMYVLRVWRTSPQAISSVEKFCGTEM